MKGYKVFNPDWTCHDFQYEVGKTFKHEGEIEVCDTGFHFCEKAIDCFKYYDFNSNNKVAEIEAIGNIKTGDDKFVTDEIRIVRELSWHEVLDLVNTGSNCTGYNNIGDYNSGNHNSGNCNSGGYNSGNYNSGDCNSGDYNSGSCNSGDRNSSNNNSGDGNSGDENSGNYNSGNGNSGIFNSGDCNSGDFNSGDFNSGDFNSGDWNSCNFSIGFFNSISQPIYAFNEPLNISKEEFRNCDGVQILRNNYCNNFWVCDFNMTDEEKKNHLEYKSTGGYLKTVDFKTACKIMWDKLSDTEKQAVKEIPNFDAKVFKEITGISVEGE